MDIKDVVKFGKHNAVKVKSKPKHISKPLSPSEQQKALRSKPKPSPAPKGVEEPKAKVTPKTKKKAPKPEHITRSGPLDQPTLDCLLKQSEGVSKIGKKDLFLYENKKTLLNSKVLATDVVIEVTIVNADDAMTNKFISVTPKTTVVREFKEVAKRYIILPIDRRTCHIVERRYMEEPEFKEYRDTILDQF